VQFVIQHYLENIQYFQFSRYYLCENFALSRSVAAPWLCENQQCSRNVNLSHYGYIVKLIVNFCFYLSMFDASLS